MICKVCILILWCIRSPCTASKKLNCSSICLRLQHYKYKSSSFLLRTKQDNSLHFLCRTWLILKESKAFFIIYWTPNPLVLDEAQDYRLSSSCLVVHLTPTATETMGLSLFYFHILPQCDAIQTKQVRIKMNEYDVMWAHYLLLLPYYECVTVHWICTAQNKLYTIRHKLKRTMCRWLRDLHGQTSRQCNSEIKYNSKYLGTSVCCISDYFLTWVMCDMVCLMTHCYTRLKVHIVCIAV